MLVVEKSEFSGTWLVSTDGRTGRLTLQGVGDPQEESYTLTGQFMDADGQAYPVDSIVISVHKISFVIRFTEYSQLFRGYLFTETRDAMAGYTIRGDERYGWFAILASSPLVRS